jgi:hypothetical protein
MKIYDPSFTTMVKTNTPLKSNRKSGHRVALLRRGDNVVVFKTGKRKALVQVNRLKEPPGLTHEVRRLRYKEGKSGEGTKNLIFTGWIPKTALAS